MHMTWQRCCHAMCENLLRSDSNELKFRIVISIKFEILGGKSSVGWPPGQPMAPSYLATFNTDLWPAALRLTAPGHTCTGLGFLGLTLIGCMENGTILPWMSEYEISWNFKMMIFGFWIFISLSNLTGNSVAKIQRCLSNLKGIWKF